MGKTMGTQYHITFIVPENQPSNTADLLKREIDKLLLDVNQQMSTYLPDSEISQFNRYNNTDWFSVSKDFAFVVFAANHISEKTQGSFDISVAPLIDLWGFGVKSQLEIPSTEKINQAVQNVDYRLINVRQEPPALKKSNKNLRIDLSAIAKGFAVDKVAAYLHVSGYSDFLVEIGGEIRNQGFNHEGKPWRVGIEAPNKKGIKDYLITSNMALATSGDYRNFFVKDGVKYSHTLNPTTGRPVKHKLASITVLEQSAMLADAYATAFMVMGANKGKAFANNNNIRVNMIIKENDSFVTWQNIDEIKIKQSTKKCKKVGGCTYLD